MDYKQKYLKYKQKYIELQKLIGGNYEEKKFELFVNTTIIVTQDEQNELKQHIQRLIDRENEDMPKLMEWNTELEKPLSLDRFIEIRYNVTLMIKAAKANGHKKKVDKLNKKTEEYKKKVEQQKKSVPIRDIDTQFTRVVRHHMTDKSLQDEIGGRFRTAYFRKDALDVKFPYDITLQNWDTLPRLNEIWKEDFPEKDFPSSKGGDFSGYFIKDSIKQDFINAVLEGHVTTIEAFKTALEKTGLYKIEKVTEFMKDVYDLEVEFRDTLQKPKAEDLVIIYNEKYELVAVTHVLRGMEKKVGVYYAVVNKVDQKKLGGHLRFKFNFKKDLEEHIFKNQEFITLQKAILSQLVDEHNKQLYKEGDVYIKEKEAAPTAEELAQQQAEVEAAADLSKIPIICAGEFDKPDTKLCPAEFPCLPPNKYYCINRAGTKYESDGIIFDVKRKDNGDINDDY